MTIREDFEKYLDHEGLIAQEVAGGSLNGVLYTSIAAIVLQDNKEYVPSEWKDKLSQCFIQKGLLSRTPSHHPDQQAPDDYIGLIAAGSICNINYCPYMNVGSEKWVLEKTPVQKVILYYSEVARPSWYNHHEPKKTWLGPFWFNYVFNNRIPGTMLHDASPEEIKSLPLWHRVFLTLFAKPGYKINFNAWFGRMKQFVAHLKWANNISPSLTEKLVWSLSVILGSYSKPENQDGWILSWLLVRNYENSEKHSFLANIAANWWRKRLYKQFPNGLKDLKYLDGNHPITRFWKK